MLSMHQVTKEYDMRLVIDEVTLALHPGKQYLLTAENGSGKTTLLNLMAGLAKPTTGRVLWSGKPFRPRDRRHLGVVLQAPLVYGDLTGYENLYYYANLYGCAEPAKTARQWFEKVGLRETDGLMVRDYSKGMKQRLALARAMLHQPSVLLLDEPFDGLDGKSTAMLADVLNELGAAGRTLFMVTHQEHQMPAPDYHYTLKFGRLTAIT